MGHTSPRQKARGPGAECRQVPSAYLPVLFPALTVPAWLGCCYRGVWGRSGRWLALAVGTALNAPYLVWAGVAAVLLGIMTRLIGSRVVSR